MEHFKFYDNICAFTAGCSAQEDEDTDVPTVNDDLGSSREGSRTDAEAVDRWVSRGGSLCITSFVNWC